MREDEDAEDDETEGSDEDVCGVAVSITSPEEVEDPEGNRNSMSPCLQKIKRNKKIKAAVWLVKKRSKNNVSGKKQTHQPTTTNNSNMV